MKLIIFILSSASISSTYLTTCNGFNTCQKGNNTIEWGANQKIEWKDFKGTMPSNFQYSVNSNIKIKLSYKSKNDGLKYQVCVSFIKDESFYRNSSDTTDYILNHEQKHFDIGEISARVLRKDLYELSTGNETITPDKINDLYAKCMSYCKDVQKEYDTETFRSQNAEKQEIWDIRIAKMLDSLSQYK